MADDNQMLNTNFDQSATQTPSGSFNAGQAVRGAVSGSWDAYKARAEADRNAPVHNPVSDFISGLAGSPSTPGDAPKTTVNITGDPRRNIGGTEDTAGVSGAPSNVQTGVFDPNQRQAANPSGVLDGTVGKDGTAPRGPVSAAVANTPALAPGEAYPGQNANAALVAGYSAQQQQRQGDAINLAAQQAQHAAALPSYAEQQQAKSAARVANWRATNGADVVLAGGNKAYASQRAGIADAAKAANAQVALNDAAVRAAGPQPVQRNLVQEALGISGAGNQATDTASKSLLAQTAAQRGAAETGEIKSKTAGNDMQTQIAAHVLKVHEAESQMMQKLTAAKSPEERQAALSDLMQFRGQSPHVAIVDQDTGQRDTMGNPVYKKVAVNTMTGQFLEPQGTMGGQQHPNEGQSGTLNGVKGKVVNGQFVPDSK